MPERLYLKNEHRHSPPPLSQSPLIFPALSLAIFFARAPLSERLEQAIIFALFRGIFTSPGTKPLGFEKFSY